MLRSVFIEETIEIASLLKARTAAKEATVWRSLQNRSMLSDAERQYCRRLEKGTEGEQRLDRLTEFLKSDVIVLQDLCLEFQRSVFQIDTLLISGDEILLLEVKNYEGDFVYGHNHFRTLPAGHEIISPLQQLNRSVTLLRSLLGTLNVRMAVRELVVFVHPQFTLFEAPADAPFLFPGQLSRFFERFDRDALSAGRQQQELADRLIGLHFPESPYMRMPEIRFSELRKGIICPSCNSFMRMNDVLTVICGTCRQLEPIDDSILRSIEELALLFPDQPITTASVYEWCGIIPSRKTVWRVLVRHLQPKGSRRNRYYVR